MSLTSPSALDSFASDIVEFALVASPSENNFVPGMIYAFEQWISSGVYGNGSVSFSGDILDADWHFESTNYTMESGINIMSVAICRYWNQYTTWPTPTSNLDSLSPIPISGTPGVPTNGGVAVSLPVISIGNLLNDLIDGLTEMISNNPDSTKALAASNLTTIISSAVTTNLSCSWLESQSTGAPLPFSGGLI